jgi:hypothetical protein
MSSRPAVQHHTPRASTKADARAIAILASSRRAQAAADIRPVLKPPRVRLARNPLWVISIAMAVFFVVTAALMMFD